MLFLPSLAPPPPPPPFCVVHFWNISLGSVRCMTQELVGLRLGLHCSWTSGSADARTHACVLRREGSILELSVARTLPSAQPFPLPSPSLVLSLTLCSPPRNTQGSGADQQESGSVCRGRSLPLRTGEVTAVCSGARHALRPIRPQMRPTL